MRKTLKWRGLWTHEWKKCRVRVCKELRYLVYIWTLACLRWASCNPKWEGGRGEVLGGYVFNTLSLKPFYMKPWIVIIFACRWCTWDDNGCRGFGRWCVVHLPDAPKDMSCNGKGDIERERSGNVLPSEY